jgi:hypothetical protein
MSEQTNKIYEQLTAEFAPEALSVDSSRGFELTSIKAQYVRERLNEVFGFMNWTFDGEYKEVETDGVLFFGTLTVKYGDEMNSINAVGYAPKKKNVGDMYKSANTDCLSKAASNLGVGNSVYKGLVSAESVKKANQTTKLPQKRSSFNKPGSKSNSVNKGWS